MLKFRGWSLLKLHRFLNRMERLGWQRDSKPHNTYSADGVTFIFEEWVNRDRTRALFVEYVYGEGASISPFNPIEQEYS